jgi:lipoyl(octanoyl) transferase
MGRSNPILEPELAHLKDWGLRDYGEVLKLQEDLRARRRAGEIPDTWLAGEHSTVITQGVRGRPDDLCAPAQWPIYQIDRGGMATIHNPGQLVIYPIVKTGANLVAQARLSRFLLTAVRDWIERISGVSAQIQRGRPGLYVKGRKLAAIGLSVRGGVSMHGIAVNLCNDLTPWDLIVPCGEPATRPVTLTMLTDRCWTPAECIRRIPDWLRGVWGYGQVIQGI